MKKSRLLLAAVATLTLAGCSIDDLMFWKKNKSNDDTQEEEQQKPADKKWEYNPEITGGTEAQHYAILDTLNNKPICNQNGKSTNEIFPETTPTLSEDDGDGIKLTTKQINGNETVTLTWTIDETQEYFGSRLKSDDAHDIIEIKYKGYGNPNGTFKWVLAKLECGEAVANADIEFSAITKNEVFKHDNVTIAQIYAIHDEEKVVDAGGTEHKFASTFDIVDYEYHDGKDYSPYFLTNNPDATEKQYLYYNVPGKVVYTSPDGNWGLLADGKNFLEFYAGSGTAFTVKNWPNLANQYVKISGNMSQYCGNVQLAFATKIVALNDAEKALIAEPEPVDYFEISESVINSLIVANYTAQKQAVILSDGSCLSNRCASVTGTLKAGSIKDSSGNEVTNIDSLPSAKRFTFTLQVGGHELGVAYDYHTDKDGTHGVISALKTALKAGGQMTLKGTMRYSGNDSGCFITEGNNGVWNIVPFLAEHIA